MESQNEALLSQIYRLINNILENECFTHVYLSLCLGSSQKKTFGDSKRYTDAATVEAQVLEYAELAMHAAVERGGSESEKVEIERTSEYVNSQINLQNNSPSPPLARRSSISCCLT